MGEGFNSGSNVVFWSLLVLNRKVGGRFLDLDIFPLIPLDCHHHYPLFFVYWIDCGCGFRRL